MRQKSLLLAGIKLWSLVFQVKLEERTDQNVEAIITTYIIIAKIRQKRIDQRAISFKQINVRLLERGTTRL
jgi:hypothetical protein